MMRKFVCMRVLACILTMLMMLSVVSVLGVSAETTGTTDDGFVYSVSGNEVTITGYTGDATELVIPSEIEGHPVTTIGANAFIGCNTLISVSIPESVISADVCPFFNCSALTRITIPSSLTSIDGAFFGYCESIVEIIVDDDNPIFDSRDNCNAIIETATNTMIAGCKTTTIPESVTSIGDSAFYGCKELESIVIPESVTSIGGYAFQGCEQLESIVIPEGVNSIGERAFYDCSSLKMVNIPEGVIKIEAGTFNNCRIDTITIPESVTSIGHGAFSGSSIKNVVIPDSVSTLDESAFYNCQRLESIKLGRGITVIKRNTFENCDSLTSIIIPDNIELIERFAFYGCSSLERVEIGAGVDCIQQEAFQKCDYITDIIISKNNTAYNSGINDNVIIENETNMLIYAGKGVTEIPQGVNIIGSGVFMGRDLKTIIIPSGVTKINSEAFYFCADLESIIIPSSVEYIGGAAFFLTGIKDIYYTGSQNQWEDIFVYAVNNEPLINATMHFNHQIPEVKGCSLTLSGNIGVNFFMNLPSDVLADRNAKVVFTCNNITTQVPASSGIKTENGYKFTCEIPAKDMTSAVTCKVVSSMGNSQSFTYSVKDYAEVILADPTAYGENTVELVKSMLNYGAAAQEYFGYNTGNLANDTAYMTSEDKLVAQKDFSNLGYTLTQGSTDVTYYGTALSLKSEVAIKHYFILSEGVDVNSLNVTVNGNSAKLVKSGDLYQLIISDIAAHNLYNKYVVKIDDLSLSYCAMDYAAMAQQAGNAKLLNIMYAIDAYAMCAQAY